jgi:hypothetical protein
LLNSIFLKSDRKLSKLYQFSDSQILLQYLDSLNKEYLNKFWKDLPLLEEITFHYDSKISVVYKDQILIKEKGTNKFHTYNDKSIEDSSLDELNSFFDDYFEVINCGKFSLVQNILTVTFYNNGSHSLM